MVSSSISTNPSSIPQVVTTQRTAMADHLQQRQPKQQQQQQRQLELPPGFRFHPTDEEIITFYLTPKVLDRTFVAIAIGEVDLNKCEPWDLPDKAKMGEKEWYFYCQKDRKYPTGMRTNRATEAGYWKATGKDKEIFAPPPPVLVGMKKTLVFYKGRAPRGEKTNWVMHEYRIETRKEDVPYATSSATAALINAAAKDEWVVCRIFHKNSGIKKVVMPSYTMAAMPMFMGGAEQQQSFVVDSGTLPPLVDYATSSSTLAPPPPHLHASSYQMNAAGTGTSMMGGASLPMMNGNYFGNQGNHQMMGPPPLMSFYHQQQQQMQMMDQGFMAGAGPGSGPSSMVSQEDTGTVLSNNDQSNAGTPAAEISSVNMGMDGMWKY
uniref:Uncharacterized protein n=1 Tax=Avena sativa TaxID=4498 RepID=A0ACD5VBQ6_AVESA